MTKAMVLLDTTEHESDGDKTGAIFGYVAFALIAFGVVVRCVQYRHYRALFHDEAMLASNALDRSVRDLFLLYGDSMTPGAYMA